MTPFKSRRRLPPVVQDQGPLSKQGSSKGQLNGFGALGLLPLQSPPMRVMQATRFLTAAGRSFRLAGTHVWNRPYVMFFLLALTLFGCRREPEATGTQVPATGIPPSAAATIVPAEATGEQPAPDQSQVTPAPLASSTHTLLIPLTSDGEPQATPGAATSQPAGPTPTASLPRPSPTPDYPLYEGEPLARAKLGVQVHIHREDINAITADLRTLGVGLVKVQVSWKVFQPAADRYDDYLLAELDRLVEAAEDSDVEVFLGVAKAPEWSRPTPELDGPPSNNDDFRAFMAYLADRYRGRVVAYELWNEPNLQREWNGFPLSAASFVNLLAAGAAGVRAADPEALVVSGAPATTGINDGVTAIDDRQYLSQMVTAGVAGIVDAIGAHPYGWANPPDSTAANPDPNVPSHNNHPSFFFADTLQDYRAILDQAGYTDKPIWVTEFGWGSYDGLGSPPPAEVSYMGAVNEWQQATYTLRAFEMGQQWPWVGPMILWNLNIGPTFGPDYPESAYSLLRPDGSRRPVYRALSSAAKQTQ